MAETSTRTIRRQSMDRPGRPPGTLEVDPDWPEPIVTVIAFKDGEFIEETVDNLDRLPEYTGAWDVVWINVNGLGSAEMLLTLGSQFNLHRLALEDVVSMNQRAKVDQYENEVFLITRMVSFDQRLESEQLSLFLLPGVVITLQEREGDCLEPVRKRIRNGSGRVRDAGGDYLAYAILDAVVDHFFPVLERFGDRLAELENEAMDLDSPDDAVIRDIHAAKRDMRQLRRAIWPQRDAINILMRDSFGLIDPETQLYLRDCYDHVTRIIDTLENYREMATDLLNAYHSKISNRMNAVMKVLTVIATIFIPLSFVAGLYGMNFDPDVSPWNMPELRWRYGYPACLAVMASIAAGMLIYFRRKRWI